MAEPGVVQEVYPRIKWRSQAGVVQGGAAPRNKIDCLFLKWTSSTPYNTQPKQQ